MEEVGMRGSTCIGRQMSKGTGSEWVEGLGGLEKGVRSHVQTNSLPLWLWREKSTHKEINRRARTTL